MTEVEKLKCIIGDEHFFTYSMRIAGFAEVGWPSSRMVCGTICKGRTVTSGPASGMLWIFPVRTEVWWNCMQNVPDIFMGMYIRAPCRVRSRPGKKFMYPVDHC